MSKTLVSTILTLLALQLSAAAEPTKLIPDDPFFAQQLSFDHAGGRAEIHRASYAPSPMKIRLRKGIHHNLARAWSVTTGSRDTVVAFLDDGFFYGHEDLKGNIWQNPGESGSDDKGFARETNGVDDDGNGFVDDVVGWDFVFDDPDPDCYAFDGRDVTRIQPYWHSIDALGIVGARGNNGIGVAGINWNVSLMLLKTAAQGDTGGERRVLPTARAIRYAVDNGARVINWSGFVPAMDPEKLAPLQAAFDYAEKKGVLIVVAAGNYARNLDLEENWSFPVSAPNENVMAVGEVDFDGTLYRVPEDSRFIGGSDYGLESVEIAALAQNYTTHVRHARSVYRISGGTSNAAPVVTGVAALVFGLRPELGALEVKQILMRSARKLPGLKGKIGSGGMVDAYAAVMLALEGAEGNAAETSSAGAALADKDELLSYWNEHRLSPQEYLLSKFRDKRWVFVGDYHRIRHDLELIGSLIPLLHETTDVRHLAFEFLCRDRTEEANRLVAAGIYDREAMHDFFRGQFPSWGYEEYLAIFRQAWESNRKFAGERGPFRLVGLNPCADWETINHSTDVDAAAKARRKIERYDEIMAEAVEENLLRPGHKALVFTGIAHATGKFAEYRHGTEEQLVRMGNMLYREPYKKDMFFVSLHAPFWDGVIGKELYPFDGVLDELMLDFGGDIGFDVVGTPFEGLVHRTRSPLAITAHRFGELFDGYVIFRTPIKEYVGVTCIEDWITTEEELRQFALNLSNKEASERFLQTPLEEFRRDHCAPRPDHGPEFRRRFRRLPDLPQSDSPFRP